MTLVKICGLRTTADAAAVRAAGADMAGFVFAPGSRRLVTPERAAGMRRALGDGVTAVGVFVDADPAFIARLVSDGTISVVQLHGSEDESYVRDIRASTGAPVIRAFTVASRGDVEAAASSCADIVMLDSGRGSGRPFDHSLIEGMGRDYILSGGLGPGDVADAVRTLRPMGVDVSSGVERDGAKDPSLISRFVSEVRSAFD